MATSTTDFQSYTILDLSKQLERDPFWRTTMKDVKARADLPDIKRRRGLKEAHDKFDGIRARLDAIYGSAQMRGDLKTMASVVVYTSQMCVDTLLSAKFMASGLMSKVAPLLGQHPPTRRIALQVLVIVAHHGGPSVTQELTNYVQPLLGLIDDYFDDDDTVRVATSVMVPIFRCLFSRASPFSPSPAQRRSLSQVLHSTITILGPPLIPARCILPDALQLLVAPTGPCPGECRANPSVMPILAAVTLCESFGARAAALNGLINLHQPSCDESSLCPFRLTEVLLDGIPPHLVSSLLPTYPRDTYSIKLLMDSIEYVQLVEKLAGPTSDLYALGKQLAELAHRHDFVVTELIDDRDAVQNSVYFPAWQEKFAACARELRRRAASEWDHDLADVLEMKILMLRGDFTEARERAKRAIVRTPGLAYAHYVMTRGAPTPTALQAAKEGLRCHGAPPFTRSQLLWVAVEMAARAALILQGSSVDFHPRVMCLASSALADAQTFLAEVPRDHPSTGNVLNWVILLTILLRKPELGRNVESVRLQLRQCIELMDRLGYKSLDMDLQLTQEFLFREYERGSQDWEHFVRGLDSLGSRAVHLSPERDEFLWLDHLQASPDHLQPSPDQSDSLEKLSEDRLYRCSWCRRPSARLRLCTGCKVAMYCDSVCQRAHWQMHREACRKGKV